YLTNTPPQARVIASVTGGTLPLTVDFDASTSFDIEGSAMSFSWTFADGSLSATGVKVSHTFSQAGEYPVTLAVTDSHGAGGITVVTITVSEKGPRITGASIAGKKLFVNGADFDNGAKVLINGEQQKTANDDQSPTTTLVCKKAGKNIGAGQTVTLQVRNPDG